MTRTWSSHRLGLLSRRRASWRGACPRPGDTIQSQPSVRMCLLVEAAARSSRELPGQAAAEVRVRAANVLSLGDAEVRPAERWVAAGRILGADGGDAGVTACGTLGRARSANIVALAGQGRGGGRGGRRSGGGRCRQPLSRGRGGGRGGGWRPSRGRGGGGGGGGGGRRPSRG